MSRIDQSVDVAIIGAGPAGLTAAYLLTKKGFSVTVIEKDPVYVGGISRTVELDGYRFDIGGHRFFSKSKEVVDLWNEILPDDFIQRPRMSRIYYEGKFYSYPLRAFEALWNLGVWRSTLCMASFAKAKLFPNRNVRSFQDWTVNAFGHKLFSIFFKTYTEKVWGMPCDEMSADWAAQRIKGLSLWGAVVDGLKRSLGLNKKPNDGMATKTLLETFRYPRLGPGMMWEAARDRVIEGGNQILMAHSLKQLAQDQGTQRWRVVADGPDGDVIINAAHVISSAPMRELAARIHPLPETLPEAMELKYRDFLTVALMIKSEDLFPDNWIYIHDSKVQVGRIQNFRSWSPEMVPDESVACVGLEYFCFEGDGLWSSADADLIDLAKKEMAILGLCNPDDVVGGAVVRQEKAYPVYDDAYADHVLAMRTELEAVAPTLHLVGRNGMHRYNNQDHAMMTAMLTVRNIEAGTRVYDVWGVNEDAEYHESGEEGQDVEGQRAALASERLVPSRLKAA
ncbi:NAD(P)/FAD-dependent oxidoreductase [Sphingobium yanoikuyae]|uniref:NAD(P)/FAD-dependent oxidoreductase n=1 Tax=Sphingobium yanoikuyae TaxID=13690 RepID=A0A084ECJ4_SPHYA|nr:NAD(P)/FAD-dependent oxidoreductase [Sphingobium yanoikuyae]AYO79535.1 NAD(P)/FAD-dependent oxidoreductase [Sphingobium yanoikuyae]KEZ15686.1 Protoporphyrinogen oxidase [Sphingobium yanoikuyae]KFD27274.1 FAD-dependent oxidoreductase [Sphingobium yanoikuyae]KZC80096.1 FAD-dependent oxidoreductase [Sphingobium yanoikuyae]MDV3481636.1 NAD(P)/FAD-dependent oxidoreductase [Sphingobium yanoikuyae]